MRRDQSSRCARRHRLLAGGSSTAKPTRAPACRRQRNARATGSAHGRPAPRSLRTASRPPVLRRWLGAHGEHRIVPDRIIGREADESEKQTILVQRCQRSACTNPYRPKSLTDLLYGGYLSGIAMQVEHTTFPVASYRRASAMSGCSLTRGIRSKKSLMFAVAICAKGGRA